jgi:uncharacterized membrane protein
MLRKKVPRTRIAAEVFVLAILLCAIPCTHAQAKSYRINKVDVAARIFADGSMVVTESRTYDFRGSFSFAYRDLPVVGPVRYGDFGVSEGAKDYRLSDSQEPGTYHVERSADRIRVTWHYHAVDQPRTFDFHYRAAGAIARYEDAAVLYFKFLAEDWNISQDDVTVTVEPPAGISGDMVNEWVHGPLWARSIIKETGTVVILCEHLPARTYLELRALYPPEAFPLVEPREGMVRPQIMEEEARWAEEANRQRRDAAEQMAIRARRTGVGKWLVIGIALAGIGLWAWIRSAFSHKPRVPHLPSVASEIPGAIPPAMVDYLLNSRRITGGALAGTMLDLARRGIVKLREERVQHNKLFGGTKLESEYYWDLDRKQWSEASDLTDYERDLLTFIFDESAEGADSISLEALKKKRRDFIRFFRGWSKKVESQAEAKQWFDRRSIGGFYRSLILGIVMMGLAIPSGIFFEMWGVLLIVAGGVVLILSFTIPHRTEAGEVMARRWKALQRYLKRYEFRSADRSDLLAHISDYLMYGVVLGLSTRIYEELAACMPEGQQTDFVPWYIYAGAGRGDFSAAAFGQAFSSMVATATSSMSTAAGAGGGASAGGGGGASSGGGGAG